VKKVSELGDDRDHRTSGDVASQVMLLLDRLEGDASLVELLAHVRAMRKMLSKETDARVPLGLFEKDSKPGTRTRGDLAHVVIPPPFVPLVFEHLVLTKEVAESYELFSFMVGPANQVVGAESVPLETFAVDHYLERPELAEVQRWRCTDVFDVCTRATMVLKCVRDGAPYFRGLFWCRVVSR